MCNDSLAVANWQQASKQKVAVSYLYTQLWRNERKEEVCNKYVWVHNYKERVP